MSVRDKRRTSERGTVRCTDRYSDARSDAPTVAEIEIEIEIERRGRYSDHSCVRYSDSSNTAARIKDSLALENPYRTFTVDQDRLEFDSQPQTARAVRERGASQRGGVI